MLWLLAALVLFVVSVFADRVLHADTLAKWSLGLSILPLFLAIEFFMLDLVLGMPPLELRIIDFSKWAVSKFGGWSPFLAALYFCGAIAAGVMFLLARFVNAVEPVWYGFSALVLLVDGIVFLVGFFVFFNALSLILGIVATIIGIIVGLRKLALRNSE